MKKTVPSVVILLLAAVGAALFFTNPTEEDYAEYLSQTVADEVQSSLCQPEGFSEWLGRVGEALSSACQGILAGGESLSQAEVEDLIVENTQYNNRIFLSTYVTESPFGNYRAIGFLNRFVLQPQPAQTEE